MNSKLLSICLLASVSVSAQSVVSTGGKIMPDEWIDSATHHRVIKLTRMGGSNMAFYFHNNPFIGNKMVYYHSGKIDNSTIQKQEISNSIGRNRQIFLLDLNTLKSEQLTNQPSPMNGEIVYNKGGIVFYQIKDSVWSVDAKSKESKLVFVFPPDFKASITTVNANGTLLGGSWSSDAEKEIFKKYPNKSDFFNRIYESKLPRTLFTIDVKTGTLTKLFTDTAWLNHVQFSPADPNLMMFCHEGPWHKVDRIWTINIKTKEVKLMHKRTMNMEIAGHEWFQPDGNRIWFDLQQPRSVNFFVAGTDVHTGNEVRYALQRDEWSIHFNISPDQKLFCGDGGNEGQVAKAKDGMWIYLFRPQGDHFVSEKLVDMKNHNYKLEPNVHFSPDGKWIIFRANFEGVENVYAAEIKPATL